MIPNINECFELMKRHHMLPNIIDHSIMVARVAEIITGSLNNIGHKLFMSKIIAGALLHDIASFHLTCTNANPVDRKVKCLFEGCCKTLIAVDSYRNGRGRAIQISIEPFENIGGRRSADYHRVILGNVKDNTSTSGDGQCVTHFQP